MISVILFLFVSICQAALKPRVIKFDVDKERSIGLQNLFEQLQKRSSTLTWQDISKAMAWMVRHQKLMIVEEIVESRKEDSSCLLWNQSLKTILRYFPLKIQKKIIKEIKIKRQEEIGSSALTIINSSLMNKFHLIMDHKSFLGFFGLLPPEVISGVLHFLKPNDLMNMMLCSWDIHDKVADLTRSKCHRFEDQDRVWVLCLRKIHQFWHTNLDDDDKRSIELMICSNLQASLFYETLILQKPFKCNQWQVYYRNLVEKSSNQESGLQTGRFWQNTFDGWINEFALFIQPSVLELLIKIDKSIVVTWRTIKYAIQGKLRTSAVLVLLNHVSETSMIKTIAPTAIENGYDASVVLPCIKAHLLVFKKLYKEELELVVKYSRNSEDLLEFLNLSELSDTTIPTWRTINRLLSGKFNEEICNLFFDKYPYAQIGPENFESINKLEMSPTFYARLLMTNDLMRVSALMMEKLPAEVPEDLYLLFLSRSSVPLSPLKVIEVMNRKFGDPTIRFMIRSCSLSLRAHHIEPLKKAALENGYSKSLLEFIDGSLKNYLKKL